MTGCVCVSFSRHEQALLPLIRITAVFRFYNENIPIRGGCMSSQANPLLGYALRTIYVSGYAASPAPGNPFGIEQNGRAGRSDLLNFSFLQHCSENLHKEVMLKQGYHTNFLNFSLKSQRLLQFSSLPSSWRF